MVQPVLLIISYKGRNVFRDDRSDRKILFYNNLVSVRESKRTIGPNESVLLSSRLFDVTSGKPGVSTCVSVLFKQLWTRSGTRVNSTVSFLLKVECTMETIVK